MVRGPAIASEGRGVPPALKEGRWRGIGAAVGRATPRRCNTPRSGVQAGGGSMSRRRAPGPGARAPCGTNVGEGTLSLSLSLIGPGVL